MVFETRFKELAGSLADVLQTLGRSQPEKLARSVFIEMSGAMVTARAANNTGYSSEIRTSTRDSKREVKNK